MIENLIFEGGGIKGIAYCGALGKLQQLGKLNKIKRVGGSSAGAITALLIALGYNIAEITKIIVDMDFSTFADDDLGIIRDAKRVATYYGVHKGDAFLKFIRDIIEDKTGNPDLTFGRLQNPSLYVTGTNVTKQTIEIYSSEHTPHMRVSDAMRITMSIPVYYQAVFRGKEILVDGGVLWNYPLSLFDNVKYCGDDGEVVNYSSDKDFRFNHNTLGFKLDTVKMSTVKRNSGFLNFVGAILLMLHDNACKRHLHKNDWKRTVSIDTGSIHTTDFDIDDSEKRKLIIAGMNGVAKYFGCD
jgi:NTE family protein